MLARFVRLAWKAGVLGVAVVTSAFWHHGHILLFIAAVRDALSRRLAKSYNVRSESSKLFIQPDRPAMRYELVVRRKTRALEVGLSFEGDAAEAARWAAAFANRAVEIQAQLDARVELEEQTRRRFRLYESHPVGGKEWRPKHDLTDDLATETAARIARFIDVLEPILRKGG